MIHGLFHSWRKTCTRLILTLLEIMENLHFPVRRTVFILVEVVCSHLSVTVGIFGMSMFRCQNYQYKMQLSIQHFF